MDTQGEVGSGGIGYGEGERAGMGEDDGVASGLEALQLEMVFDDAPVPQVDVPVSGPLRLSLSLSTFSSFSCYHCLSLSVYIWRSLSLSVSLSLSLSVSLSVAVSLSVCPSRVQARDLSLHHIGISLSSLTLSCVRPLTHTLTHTQTRHGTKPFSSGTPNRCAWPSTQCKGF